MKRFGIFLCAILLLLSAGCGQSDALIIEDEGPVWVITEQVSYDADGNRETGTTYKYDGDANHYTQNSYNAKGELIAYDVVTISEDGKETIRKSYLPDGTEIATQIKTFRAGGKPLSDVDLADDPQYTISKTWQWNSSGTKADIMFVVGEEREPEKIGTVEYDDQNRIVSETIDGLKTTYTYEDGKDIIWSDLADGSRYVMVRRYDEQGRLVEVRDYMVQHDGDYTEDDMVNYTLQTYKEDGHSMTVEYWAKDLATGDRLTGTSEITYQLLADVV